ncbi:MAG: Holliday junction branch migration protein RuvA [Ornithinimicrobium sp.]|uniref:Holliday junction branch migration protein RuvA n=1 Tax=Ornithinimicrobium sp. TaxID=1977084 RepID=UPI003D9AF068
MISSLAGLVQHVGLDHVVVEVGGVGLRVHTTPATASEARAGTTLRLLTTLVVREESLTLYGFVQAEARALFEQVQTVSGVGPRLALAMLAVHSPEAVGRAISTGDLVALTKVPGIGRKGAERIVLELRDKVLAPGSDGSPDSTSMAQGAPEAVTNQVREALVGLGWSSKQAADAVQVVTTDAASQQESADRAGPPQVADLLRAALRELGR